MIHVKTLIQLTLTMYMAPTLSVWPCHGSTLQISIKEGWSTLQAGDLNVYLGGQSSSPISLCSVYVYKSKATCFPFQELK